MQEGKLQFSSAAEFMKVKKLPTTRMKAMIDKVISVPIEEDDVSKTLSSFPRHPDDAKIEEKTLRGTKEQLHGDLKYRFILYNVVPRNF